MLKQKLQIQKSLKKRIKFKNKLCGLLARFNDFSLILLYNVYFKRLNHLDFSTIQTNLIFIILIVV